MDYRPISSMRLIFHRRLKSNDNPSTSLTDLFFITQERWGCSRLANRSMSGSLGFAVQTHGNGIVEVTGSSDTSSHTCSNDVRYRLERRWRYEGHDVSCPIAFTLCVLFYVVELCLAQDLFLSRTDRQDFHTPPPVCSHPI